MSTQNSVSVFFAYAREDKELRDQLEAHLSILKRTDTLRTWHDQEITAGTEWIDEIQKNLESSQVILLLISADFLKSNFCYNFLTTQALKKHDSGEAIVIPILLRSVDWEGSPFSKLKMLPTNSDFVTSTENLDKAFTDVANGIRNVIENFLDSSNINTTSNDHRIIRSIDSDSILKNEISSEKRWIVKEASDHKSFANEILKLYSLISEKLTTLKEDAEVVITIYARSFPQEQTNSFPQQGVGKFEYDLIFYLNIRDETPMFGPLVKDDDRAKFAQKKIRNEFGRPKGPSKKGGFIEREGIESFAKFRLEYNSEFVGLLFINGRNFPIPENAFKCSEVKELISSIEKSVSEIKKKRLEIHNRRSGIIINRLSSQKNLDPTISENNLNIFFSQVIDWVYRITEADKLAISIYLYMSNNSERYLRWLWSNGATSSNLKTSLRSLHSNSSMICDVALDSNNKPLLLHNVQNKKDHKEKVIRTWLGDETSANLVLPILSKKGANLIGLVDIQSNKPNQFDSNDVQFGYLISDYVLSSALQKVKEEYSKPNFSLPLSNTNKYSPFQKQKLDFSVKELLELNFNPMKFILHWDKIKELITTGESTAPSSVEVWPTMSCNHSCSWCRTKDDRRFQSYLHKEMTRKELMGIAESLIQFEEIDIMISGGGEPLQHPGIHEFMNKIKKSNGIIGIFTNGTRPKNFKFWEYFFYKNIKHRFVRISFNGHDPESYYRTHFSAEPETNKKLPSGFDTHYAEARKTVLDLLGLRSSKVSVAIGDTIQHRDIALVKRKAEHAKEMGVDFIQMRPELLESSKFNERGDAVCSSVKQIVNDFTNDDFSVVHTDAERSFQKHDEPRCYAMHLVPTLVPHNESGWTRIMPCSYAINMYGQVPDLGRMKEGGDLGEFWRRMNNKLSGQVYDDDPQYEVHIEKHINPSKDGCPQCRYFRLNKRIQSIADHQKHMHLLDKLVAQLKIDPSKKIDHELREQIQSIWGDMINIDLVQSAFIHSKKLGIVPSF